MKDHISAIKKLVLTLKASPQMHALIVSGAAGWGKTTAVDQALAEANIKAVHLGSYSTPLNFFNFLFSNQDRFVVIDDSAGLFTDQSSMAILKAATWPQGGHRTLRWGSTSSKAAVDEFVFTGKFVVVCNSFPSGPDAEAVKSRSFPRRIEVGTENAKLLLRAAASDKAWYSNTKNAKAVCEFLVQRITSESLMQISYRTLRMGYELAEHNPDSWQELLGDMVRPLLEDPKVLIKKLAKEDLKVKDQLFQFERATGLKRRTFFKYRKELSLS